MKGKGTLLTNATILGQRASCPSSHVPLTIAWEGGSRDGLRSDRSISILAHLLGFFGYPRHPSDPKTAIKSYTGVDHIV